MAKKRTLKDAEAEIQALRDQLSAAGAAPDPDAPPKEVFPCVMYRKVKKSDKYPNGYEARRFRDEEAVAKADRAGWKHTPEGMDED